MKNGIVQFILWLLVMTPISVLTSEWKLLHILIFILFFITLLGFMFLKEFRKYLPVSLAFFLALGIGIFGYPFFKEMGVVDIIPNLLS